ncbi:MAG TPA: OmpA family protein [Bryobacteraceae bacterium]|nr:OmpA family protein [Bryobacteraceae bacterium]
MFSKRKITVICLAASIALIADGCKKKVPAPPPPPPAPAPAPAPPAPAAPAVAQFTVEPSTIQRGQSATLRWEVTGEATNVSINQGIGNVRSTGSQQVTPTSSTTYTLTATGPGGTITASATLTVATPPPPAPAPPPPPAATRQTVEERVSSETQDAYFDYDKSDIRGDARDALTKDAAALKSILADFPNAVITVEGHCDERGSAEYNIGLGDRRASSAKEFLVSLGVPGDRLKTVSYGKERPQCTESTESCWQRNRRAHLSVGQ